MVAPMIMAPVFERFHSFKEFMALQKDNLEPERAVALYDQYKYDFKTHSARMVFHQNQNLGFVRERFSPERLSVLAQAKIEDGQKEAKNFIERYKNGEFAELQLEFRLPKPEMAGLVLKPEPHLNGRVVAVVEDYSRFKSDDNSNEAMTDIDLCGAPYFSQNLNEKNNVLVLKKLPGDVTSTHIYEMCQDVSGLERVTLIPTCLLEENQGPLVLQASKNPSDCTEEELQAIEETMSECYIRGRGTSSPLIPLQTAWLEFDTSEHCSQAELMLEKRPIRDLCTCTPMRVQPKGHYTRRIRVCSSEPESKHLEDLKLTEQLILKLDAEFEIHRTDGGAASNAAIKDTNSLVTKGGDEDMTDADPNTATSGGEGTTDAVLNKSEEEKADEKASVDMKEGDSGTAIADAIVKDETQYSVTNNPFLILLMEEPSTKKRLDLQLLYLRRVHKMDYYSGRICWSARELFETCGMTTVRLCLGTEDVVVLDNAASMYMLQPADDAILTRRIQQILNQKFEYWMIAIGDTHPLFVDLWARFCQEKTLQVDPEKFRCGICRKLFKGAEFVWKHLKNKHISDSEPVKQGVRTQMMKQAFENDDFKLLLFVVQTNDFLKVFHNNRSNHSSSSYHRHSLDGSYGPTRRTRLAARSGPIGSLPPDGSFHKPYRDWDAPRTRLEDKAAGGNFRKMIRYDDL